MKSRALMLVVCGLNIASIAAAQDKHSATDAARDFGARELVQQISISPDGTHFAAIMPVKEHALVVAVAPVNEPTKLRVVLNADGDPERVRSCSWANDARIICTAYTIVGRVSEMQGYSRDLVINADGSGMKLLSGKDSSSAVRVSQFGDGVIDWFGDAGGSTILTTRQLAEEQTTGTITSNVRGGLGVEQVDPNTLKRKLIETPNTAVELYLTDGIGNVRLMAKRGDDSSGYLKRSANYFYRRKGSRAWEPFSITPEKDEANVNFTPQAIDPSLDVAYGLSNHVGHEALFSVTLDGTNKRQLVYSNPNVDVDGLIQIGRKRRVVGVSFTTDRRQTFFFDPTLSKLASALSKALPEAPLVTFIDSSADENRLLLWGGSDIQPGIYMTFDKQTRKLEKLMDTRPQLNSYTLAPVKSIFFEAGDGTKVPAYLTLPPNSSGKNLPAIVMPHGGPSARDEWGFDWLAQFFAQRGYAVLQPNYRGSSGYGDQWYGANGFRAWNTAIGDVDDAGRWLVKQGIAAPEHLAIVGWSYGGYAALQSQVIDPGLFKAVVAIAPVTDLGMWREEWRTYNNFKIMDAMIGEGPHIEAGSPARHPEAFKVPVLMFHGDRDQNVGIGESRLMASRLKAAGKAVELVEFKGLDHQLDDSEARATMLAKADAFLRTTMKLPE